MVTSELPWYMEKKNILAICAISVIISTVISFGLVLITHHQKDFHISVFPDNGSINAGELIQTNVIILGDNNYSRPVSLSARNLPAGVKVTFSPQSIIPTSSSIMTIEINKTVTKKIPSISIWGLGSDSKEHDFNYIIN
jgi:hypothetical protein